jgi:hypothetical protein
LAPNSEITRPRTGQRKLPADADALDSSATDVSLATAMVSAAFWSIFAFSLSESGGWAGRPGLLAAATTAAVWIGAAGLATGAAAGICATAFGASAATGGFGVASEVFSISLVPAGRIRCWPGWIIVDFRPLRSRSDCSLTP